MLPYSLDDAVRELRHADYRAAFTPHPLFQLFAHPLVPIISVATYLLLSKPFFRAIQHMLSLPPRHPVLQSIAFAHSAALAVYSAWTCYNSFSIVYARFQTVGLYDTLCDANDELWRDIRFWVIHFYISKYVEFGDTWIVLLKGRTPLFLQTFHHAAAVVLTWGFIATSTTPVVIVLVLNAAIHTLMYSYYALAALGVRSTLKQHLTEAQIVQFLIYLGVTGGLHWRDGCLSPAQSLVLLVFQVFLVLLTLLFAQFYVKAYFHGPFEKPEVATARPNGMHKKKM